MAITLSEDGYCAATDVAALLQQLTIDANSDPTTTEVEGFITEEFHIVNGMLAGLGLVVPVSQAGGTLTVTSGNKTTNAAYTMGVDDVVITGTGLDGFAQRGDLVTFAGHSQKYMINQDAKANDSNQITLAIAPPLEVDVAAGVVVTYTASAHAKNVLKRLNALGASRATLLAAYASGGSDVGEDYEVLKDQYERLFGQIHDGKVQLMGVERDRVAGPSRKAVSLVRY